VREVEAGERGGGEALVREGESQGEPLMKHLLVKGPEAEAVGVALEGDHHEPPGHVHGHHLTK